MDKHPNRTITIKINGKDRPAQEHTNKKEKEAIEVNKERPQIENVSIHSSRDDVKKIEEETFEQSAAAREEQFSWILPENKHKPKQFRGLSNVKRPSPKKVSKGFKWSSKGSFRKNKSSNKVVPSIVFIILIAVLVGTSFGLVMVNMVKSDQKAGTEIPSSEMPPVTAENGKSSLTIEAISSFVIQGGVFSTEEAAEKGLAQAINKGIPAKIIEMDNKIYLFIGVADNMDHAKAIGGKLEKEGFSFYAKEVTFGNAANTSLEKEEITLLKQASALYDTLSSMSASASLSGKIPVEFKETLSRQLEQWQKLNEKNIEIPQIQEMKKELDEGVKKIKGFEKSGDEKSLAGVQQHLLNFLALFQQL